MTGLGLTAWIYLLDKKIKEQVDSNILQGTRKEIPGGRIYLCNCHNEGMALGIGPKDQKNCQGISAGSLRGCCRRISAAEYSAEAYDWQNWSWYGYGRRSV